MRRSLLTLAAVGLLLPGLVALRAHEGQPPPSLEQTLRASRWQKRVLLVAASTAGHAGFRAQKAQLAASQAGLADRDFLVVDVLYDQLPAADRQFIAQKLGLRPPAFAAVLIGKDGGVKRRSARPLTAAELFATVDQMPMRRQEMRRPARP